MSERATIPSGSAERIFIESIKNIKELGKESKLKAAVDLGVTFSSVSINENGSLIALLKGKDTKNQSVELKLATRIYLGEETD
jgi:hypothetical protein